MIRGPHQSDAYVDQETSHADHQDSWDGTTADASPALTDFLRRDRERWSRRPSEERQHGLDLIAERRAGT